MFLYFLEVVIFSVFDFPESSCAGFCVCLNARFSHYFDFLWSWLVFLKVMFSQCLICFLKNSMFLFFFAFSMFRISQGF